LNKSTPIKPDLWRHPAVFALLVQVDLRHDLFELFAGFAPSALFLAGFEALATPLRLFTQILFIQKGAVRVMV
jgi:hypothetical protein